MGEELVEDGTEKMRYGIEKMRYQPVEVRRWEEQQDCRDYMDASGVL